MAEGLGIENPGVPGKHSHLDVDFGIEKSTISRGLFARFDRSPEISDSQDGIPRRKRSGPRRVDLKARTRAWAWRPSFGRPDAPM